MTTRIPNTDWKKLDPVLKFLWKRNFRAGQIATLFGIPAARVAVRATTLGLPQRYRPGRNGRLLANPVYPPRGPRGPYKTTKYSFSQIEVGEAKVIEEDSRRVQNAARIWARSHGAKFTINKVAENSVRVTRVA